MTDDLRDFWPPTEPRPALASPRKCLHPRYGRKPLPNGDVQCSRCDKVIAAARARRGRNSRKRGNAIELAMAKALGLRRVGQYGGPDDIAGEWLVAQVKSGGSFPERLWRWLQAVPVNAGQTRAVVVTDAPGPGHRRRALVIVSLEDWTALHAGEAEA